jgi:AcrR family transcriptional regulator
MKKSKKPAYHHGNLEQALIEEALKLVEQNGEMAVSLRDLAQSLGVSRAAPYRHFASRDDLLAAVAARGFEDLVALYNTAFAGPGNAQERLSAGSRTFFDFAMKRPGLYRLMFESDFLNRTPPPAVMLPAANASYYQLLHAVADANPQMSEAQARVRTIIMMSTSHGFLALYRAGRFKPFMYEPLSHEDMVEAVMRSLLGVD